MSRSPIIKKHYRRVRKRVDRERVIKMNFINLWFRKDPRWQFTNIDIIESITKLEPPYDATPKDELDIGLKFKGGQWFEAKAKVDDLVTLGVIFK